MTTCVSLPGSGQCTTMELGPLEGGYLELLNSNADPLQLYHLYDQMDLAGEEEMELCSGALSSLPSLPSPSPPSACSGDCQQPVSATATELRSAPRTAPVPGRRLALSLGTSPSAAPLLSSAFLTSPLPRSLLSHSRGFSPQNLTRTPSTASSSAGCCAT